MKDYYLEQANRLETQIAFAKVGYGQEVKAIAKELAECPIVEVEKVTKRLVRANEAIKALEDDYKRTVEYYRNEALKCEGGNNNG